jgi:predicted ATPase
MSPLAAGFQSWPPQYTALIQRVQEQHGISITPLQELVGGKSGAFVYLVSVAFQDSNRVEHYVLKLDRKKRRSSADEITRHKQALAGAPESFAHQHLAEIAFDKVEVEDVLAIFYAIAGQSLLRYRPASRYERQRQIGKIFYATYDYLLEGWNENRTFGQALSPRDLLQRWLGFRLDPRGNIERFLRDECRVRPETPGLIIEDQIFPNPLYYARDEAPWGGARPIDAAIGFIHGDLNTNNVLARFSPDAEGEIEGYYLIDFAMFKEGLPLIYDQRYLEMSYLILKLSQIPLAKIIDLLVRLGEDDAPDPDSVSVETAGISQVIRTARSAFGEWVRTRHPSLSDDLWVQHWLAGAAAGLAYAHKRGLSDEAHLVGLIYAATNLKRCLSMLGLPGPTEVESLYDSQRLAPGGPWGAAGKSVSSMSRHKLPVQPTTFIGRAEQVEAVRDLLAREHVRLVTLTGTGGTGKTRLALEVAGELTERFPDGVFFVPLAEVHRPEQVVSKIAQQLEVREAGSQPLLENIKRFLNGQRMLLVLDNFEQVTSAASLVAEVLSAASECKVLVTSRIVLNLRSEYVYQVPPMKTFEDEQLTDLERLESVESVQLFVARAQAVRAGFTLTEENAAAVAEICRRLDGLPLAIELAAARLNLLTPQAILSRLDDRMALLTGGPRDLPLRQQALRNTIEWSYDLMEAREQVLFTRLGVFVGGFDLEGAEAVCDLEGELDVLEGVSSLVKDSLLRQEPSASGRPRYRMLETIREYALERLAERGEKDELRRRHALYYANVLTDKIGFKLYSAEASAWMDWIEGELDNIEETLEWTQSTPEGLELGPILVTILMWFWYRRGYFHQGRRWAERVLQSPAARDAGMGRAMALRAGSLLAMWQADLPTARARADEGLQLWSRAEEDQTLAMSLMNRGIVLINMGEDQEAHPLLKQAQEIFKQVDDPYFYAITLVHLGNVALGLGDPDEARGWLERALKLSREIGDGWTISFALNNLGEVSRVEGDYDQADAYYAQSEALLREMGDHGDLARLIHSRGYTALHAGDEAGAEARFLQALSMFRKLGNQRGIAECLTGLAGLCAARSRPELGAQLLGAAHALMDRAGAAWWPADRVEIERSRRTIQNALNAQGFDEAWSTGEGMSLDRAVALVLSEFAGVSGA